MSGRIPDRVAHFRHDATVSEIAAEKAASLGRAGRRLERTLAALRELQPTADETAREDLLDDAGEAFFFYLVQREACGLRDTAEVVEAFDVPREVQLRMGSRRRRR